MLNVVVLTTGPLITLQEAKEHLSVDSSDQDDLIGLYTDAAVLSCLRYTDHKLVPEGAEPSFRVAALLNLGDLYANREAVVMGQSFGVNPTAENLLRPWRSVRV